MRQPFLRQIEHPQEMTGVEASSTGYVNSYAMSPQWQLPVYVCSIAFSGHIDIALVRGGDNGCGFDDGQMRVMVMITYGEDNGVCLTQRVSVLSILESRMQGGSSRSSARTPIRVRCFTGELLVRSSSAFFTAVEMSHKWYERSTSIIILSHTCTGNSIFHNWGRELRPWGSVECSRIFAPQWSRQFTEKQQITK